MKNKSITIIGDKVDHAYVIKNVDIDKITMERYNVECRSDIQNAWEEPADGSQKIASLNSGQQRFEILLKDKVSDTSLKAKANVIEIAAREGGKIVKDIVVQASKNGKSVRIIDFVFFDIVEN